MQFDVLTLFPDLIYNYSDESILGRAQQKGLINVRAHNFREFSGNKWGHVDDKPYGGGAGMVLRVEPIYKCLEKIGALRKKSAKGGSASGGKKSKIIIMDPAGKKFNQRMAEKFSKLDQLILIAGRYEGFDERIYKFVDEKISMGEYVLAGGELPTLTIIEAVSRLIPGVLGNEESLKEESFSMYNDAGEYAGGGQKEYPQYSRPENFLGMKVPKVLLSGDHKKIAEWRKKKSK